MLRLATCGVLVTLEGLSHAFSLSSEETRGALVGGLCIAAVSLLPAALHMADAIYNGLTSGSNDAGF